MKEKIASIAALMSAAFASICCIGPTVLVALGLGGAGLAAGLTRYRPLFLAVTAIFLGVAFYLVYRRREVACADGSCEFRAGSKGTKAALWVITAFAVSLAAFPIYAGRLQKSTGPVTVANGETVRLAITGMTCSGCAVGIQKSLMKTPGVKSAWVSLEEAEAIILVEPGMKTEALIKAVKKAGMYEVRPKESSPKKSSPKKSLR